MPPSIDSVEPPAAVSGAVIYVYGASLDLITGVTIANFPAAFSYDAGASRLAVTVPNVDASGDLVVTSPGGSATAPFTIYFPGPWIQASDQWSDWRDLNAMGSSTIRHTAPAQDSDDVYVSSPPSSFQGEDSLAVQFLAGDVGPWIWVDPSVTVYDIDEMLVIADPSYLALSAIGAPTSYPDGALSYEWENDNDSATAFGAAQLSMTPGLGVNNGSGFDTPAPDWYGWTMRRITDVALIQRWEFSAWRYTTPDPNFTDGAWLSLTTAATLEEVASWGPNDNGVNRTIDVTLDQFMNIDGHTILPFAIVPTFALPGAAALPAGDPSGPPLPAFSFLPDVSSGWPVPASAQFRAMVRPARYRFFYSHLVGLSGDLSGDFKGINVSFDP